MKLVNLFELINHFIFFSLLLNFVWRTKHSGHCFTEFLSVYWPNILISISTPQMIPKKKWRAMPKVKILPFSRVFLNHLHLFSFLRVVIPFIQFFCIHTNKKDILSEAKKARHHWSYFCTYPSNSSTSSFEPRKIGVRWWMPLGSMSNMGPLPELAKPPAFSRMNAIGLHSYKRRNFPLGASDQRWSAEELWRNWRKLPLVAGYMKIPP